MAPDRTILHLVKEINPRPPPPLKNYGVHTIKPQIRPCESSFCFCKVGLVSTQHNMLI